MMKAIIIEDEIKSVQNLTNLLKLYCEGVKVIADAGSIEDGLTLLKDPAINPDVVFFDINLPDGLVFQLIDQLENIDFEIIFVTAYEKFAIKACEYASIGYLTKPIDPDLLQAAISRIEIVPNKNYKTEERLDVFNSHYNNPNPFKKMTIPSMEGTHFIHINDIAYLKGDNNCTDFFMSNNKKRFTTTKTLKSYDDLLSPFNFFRVHKSYLVNLNFINRYNKGDGGYLIMDNGDKIEVSRRRKTAFHKKLKELQGDYIVNL